MQGLAEVVMLLSIAAAALNNAKTNGWIGYYPVPPLKNSELHVNGQR